MASSRIKQHLETSFIFRSEAESFSAFLHREKKALLVTSALFVSLYLFVIFSVDVHYFYSLMVADPLLYYLKASHLLHTGNTNASLAINAAPFNYVGLPGYLRIPILLISDSFSVQLRLIQITNVAMLWLMGVLASY